jgi:PAS domain S-box-containing protein
VKNQSASSRYQAHDTLITEAEFRQHALRKQALDALRRGDFDLAEVAISREHASVQELVENLRIYQAELYAQADELAHSQARLEASVLRFGALFSSLPLAAFLIGANGELLESNFKAQELFAFRAQGVAQRFFHRLIDAHDYQSRVRPIFLEARAHGSADCDTVGFVTEHGKRFRGDLRLAVLPGSDDGAPQYACIVEDRTEALARLDELHEANEQLVASEAAHRLASLVATSTHNPVVMADAQQRILWANPSFYALTGLTPNDITDHPLSLLWRDSGLQAGLVEDVLACLDRGEGYRGLALAGRARGGEPYWASLDLQPVRDENELLTHFIALATDMTAAHQAQQRIAELSERLTLATEAGGVGVWDWDLERGQVFFDARMRSLLRCVEPPASMRAAIEAVAGPAQTAQFDLALSALQVGGASLQFELLLPPAVHSSAQASDSHPEPGTSQRSVAGNAGDFSPGAVCLRLNGTAHRSVDGAVVRLIGCAWDCTAERVAEQLRLRQERAESASRAKSAFLSRMSHELRTPLNAILGFSQLMQMDQARPGSTPHPEWPHHIEQAARHLLALINEVLDVSRIESGRLDLDLRDIGLQSVIEHCLPLVQTLADSHAVTLKAPVTSEPPVMVYADALRLKEILTNLLSNGIKYNRPGGLITLSAEALGPIVEISVDDTGIGMTDEQLRDLFQPFNRVGAERTAVEGTGMGLFVSRRYAELMGGLLQARSTPGVGSSFVLRLPVGRSVPR